MSIQDTLKDLELASEKLKLAYQQIVKDYKVARKEDNYDEIQAIRDRWEEGVSLTLPDIVALTRDAYDRLENEYKVCMAITANQYRADVGKDKTYKTQDMAKDAAFIDCNDKYILALDAKKLYRRTDDIMKRSETFIHTVAGKIRHTNG